MSLGRTIHFQLNVSSVDYLFKFLTAACRSYVAMGGSLISGEAMKSQLGSAANSPRQRNFPISDIRRDPDPRTKLDKRLRTVLQSEKGVPSKNGIVEKTKEDFVIKFDPSSNSVALRIKQFVLEEDKVGQAKAEIVLENFLNFASTLITVDKEQRDEDELGTELKNKMVASGYFRNEMIDRHVDFFKKKDNCRGFYMAACLISLGVWELCDTGRKPCLVGVDTENYDLWFSNGYDLMQETNKDLFSNTTEWRNLLEEVIINIQGMIFAQMVADARTESPDTFHKILLPIIKEIYLDNLRRRKDEECQCLSQPAMFPLYPQDERPGLVNTVMQHGGCIGVVFNKDCGPLLYEIPKVKSNDFMTSKGIEELRKSGMERIYWNCYLESKYNVNKSSDLKQENNPSAGLLKFFTYSNAPVLSVLYNILIELIIHAHWKVLKNGQLVAIFNEDHFRRCNPSILRLLTEMPNFQPYWKIQGLDAFITSTNRRSGEVNNSETELPKSKKCMLTKEWDSLIREFRNKKDITPVCGRAEFIKAICSFLATCAADDSDQQTISDMSQLSSTKRTDDDDHIQNKRICKNPA